MKLVQNGTITATSSRRWAFGRWRLMKYAKVNPITAHTSVVETESTTLRASVCRYRST